MTDTKGAAVVRQEFGALEAQSGHEIAQTGAQARAMAEVQSAYVMAMQFPREERRVTARILAACESPDLALIHEYARPVGKEKAANGEWVEKIAKGPTIHLMRVCLAHWRNLDVYGPKMIYETPEFRVVEVGIIDLETNFRRSAQITVPRQVEKRGVKSKGSKDLGPPPGREVISKRLNTYGEPVFLCAATNDEMRISTAREAALAQRRLAEDIIPRHVVDAARAVCRRVLTEIADDRWIERILQLFAEFATVQQLEEYLGHKIETSSKDELKQLAAISNSLRDHETTWEEIMVARNPEGTREAADDVAKKKLAALGSAPKAPQETAPTRQEDAIKTQEPEAPEPLVSDEQAEELSSHAEPLPDSKLAPILKAYGAEVYADVPAKHFDAIRRDIIAAANVGEVKQKDLFGRTKK